MVWKIAYARIWTGRAAYATAKIFLLLLKSFSKPEKSAHLMETYLIFLWFDAFPEPVIKAF